MSYTDIDNPQTKGAAKLRSKVPAGYLLVADAAAKHGVETAKIHAWAKIGRVERIRVITTYAYNDEEVAACAAEYQAATRRNEAGKKQFAKTTDMLLVWDVSAREFPLTQILEARKLAATLAHHMGCDQTISTRKRWNGQIRDIPLETVSASGEVTPCEAPAK